MYCISLLFLCEHTACLDVCMCLTALGLQQFSVGKANCSLCDFAMPGPLCVCRKKESKMGSQREESVCVSEMRTRGQREHES